MKSKILFTILSAVIVANSCVQAQNSSMDNGVEKMLKEFYTKYCTIWRNTPSSVPANILHEKLDSLTQKYCTKSIRNEAKAWFEDGHDLFTNDWGIDLESLKSLSIIKDLKKSNTYTLSYIVETYPVSPDKPVKKWITLQVTVIKENNIYLINDVK